MGVSSKVYISIADGNVPWGSSLNVSERQGCSSSNQHATDHLAPVLSCHMKSCLASAVAEVQLYFCPDKALHSISREGLRDLVALRVICWAWATSAASDPDVSSSSSSSASIPLSVSSASSAFLPSIRLLTSSTSPALKTLSRRASRELNFSGFASTTGKDMIVHAIPGFLCFDPKIATSGLVEFEGDLSINSQGEVVVEDLERWRRFSGDVFAFGRLRTQL
ncbi:unnamed protein product [Darwinula stevensoni]|uniref:Uncharacterized protein n=1 Tax=Darwinula stevensoni TaxID=69355 RepID=A0A7R8X5Z2_9CRUS|nr:unnamed protein product [Darwinula stevensoni]CAG0887539.1 unnamed protein product [Darwinula stevensoni]